MLAKKMEEDIIGDKAQEEQEKIISEDNKESDKEDNVVVKETKSKKITKVEDLPGVGAATAEKLRMSGYDTLMAIAVATPGELVDASGITETVGRKLINVSRDAMDMGFESGDELLKKRARIDKISTNCDGFNDILGGGVETGAITECFGQYGSGKTQIGHQLAVNVQSYGEDACAVYIDTENTFRPERIKQFAEGAGLDPDKVLKNIYVARAYNSDHQMLLSEKVDELITKKGKNIKLVVVDSLTAHFRAEFVGRGTLAVRQQKLNKHMHVLARLADIHNLSVYVTNQVMSKPDQFFGDPTEAIGGHIVAHNSTFRIYLRKGKKGSRVAKLVDAPALPDAECTFWVKEDGIKDN
ncbi:DNA repair and recombination protein RadA [Candidatus Woesearchaeota archaeon]|jgi:DNA repair protein RadA|nr:DNA repair and recombination protein RadA [Candidatus Woesearchaeota archaeon]MBT5271863.1 DNA repair and recombination protein RadA [Candidatus Woesearchaeota archaeon]MBT6041673.1 DNA repair and recombination protein RadA [Candidatus Woesearchaeota archaeon]MBT6337351.1 DNA repair and recombination protein RadA [Candidatus Woesearchaeota archaeon]MBT7927599.1 DNA repair and recombination protein RadA [Candidatus Woesearchaeota archaeon]